MTAGLSAAKANSILNTLRATSFASQTPFVKLHIGDPGSAGTANPSALTARNALTLAAPSAGSSILSSLATYTMTASETLTHISIWDAVTAGNFIESWPLTTPVVVINGTVLTFNTFTLSFTPIAA